MDNLTQHNARQLAQHRWLWSIMLIIWLIIITVSIVHTQEHTLNNDNQCQWCISNFNHSPFITSHSINLTVTIQYLFIIELFVISIEKKPPTTFYNRGPPNIYSS